MKIIAASDFHLSFKPRNDEERKRNRLVLSFLDSLKGKTDMLVLAGDIFDLWYDWESVIIKGYFPFLKKLADLKESGCRLVFIAGNHDFWFGNFLQEYLACSVHLHAFTEVLDGKRLYISHGDLCTTNDKRYRMFHFLLRNRISRMLFSWMHPNIALSLGMKASRTSRARNNSIDLPETERTNGLELYARKIASAYDVIIMGHSHNSVIKQINDAVYVNTGYWGEDNSYAEIVAGKVSLQYFKGMD